MTGVVAIVFGLVPVLPMPRGFDATLRSGGRGSTEVRSRWAREGLLALQVGFSLLLVFAGSLLLKSALRVGREPLGFRIADVWTIRVAFPEQESAVPWADRMERITQALAAEPGVAAVAYGLSAPLEDVGGSCCWSRNINLPGVPADGPEAAIHAYAGDYDRVLEPRVIAGRSFDDTDVPSAPVPALLGEALAHELFGSASDALGREIALGDVPHRVTGVVGEDRHYGPNREHRRAAYVPIRSVPFTPDRLTVVVRVEPGITDVSRRLRGAIWKVEPALPLPLVRSMEELSRAATARFRFDAWLFGVFATVALMLAAGGIFGTLLYTVGLERRAAGIRLALGSERRRVEAHVLGRALRPTVVGLVVGGIGALAAGRLLQSRLFRVDPADPILLSAAAGLLLLTALAASWIPARQAGAIDPAETLRRE